MYLRLPAHLVALALLLADPQGAPPQQQPVFRAGVETVAVYATVTNRAGELVRNLTRDDFQVFDNGVLQSLTVFENSIQPITAILLVDTSASMAPTLDFARQAAEQFVIRMMPGDRARVGSFSDRIDLTQEFTGNRDELLLALREKLHIGNPTRLWDALDETMNALADSGGRRVAVLFTDGEDTASGVAGRDVLERAKADDLMIYAVQIRSRAVPGIERQILGPAPRTAPPPRGAPTPTQILRGLAGQSGGLHFALNQNDDVNATFTQVAFELRHQYLLGFTPARLDGGIHELEVRTRNDRLTVRARKFYEAPRSPARGPERRR